MSGVVMAPHFPVLLNVPIVGSNHKGILSLTHIMAVAADSQDQSQSRVMLSDGGILNVAMPVDDLWTMITEGAKS